MLEVRKVYTVVEETWVEGGKEVNPPIRTISAIAVIRNPWHGRGYVEDLKPEILACAPKLGELLVKKLFEVIDSPDEVEAFGKAALVGVDGEVEHASALIHTFRFGNKFRDAVQGTSILPFTNKRGGPGSYITVPMVHKTDDSKRSHFITFEINIPDAPRSDEIMVAIGASTGGRPHPRIGDRHQDMLEMGFK
ncbi:amino acid synthesis family protein [Aeribacillus pallidus]|nr:amino acid synthesis family protein [Aeribacillus pallidus]MDR9797638.1 amino acid synthesis family protein [Aeribacillus pallidus]